MTALRYTVGRLTWNRPRLRLVRDRPGCDCCCAPAKQLATVDYPDGTHRRYCATCLDCRCFLDLAEVHQ